MIYQYITIIAIALGVAILFDFILKGVSLWHAGKNKQKGWFVALLIINSLGLLPIIYLLFFRSDKVALRKVKKDEKKALKKVNEDKKKSKEDEKTALKKVDAKKEAAPVDLPDTIYEEEQVAKRLELDAKKEEEVDNTELGSDSVDDFNRGSDTSVKVEPPSDLPF